MHLHLFNCHGEWNAVALAAAQAPFVMLWLRHFFRKTKNKVLDKQDSLSYNKKTMEE